MKKIAILGSTGSIGKQALEIAAAYPELFQVVGLAAGRQRDALARQVADFRPAVVSLADADGADRLQHACAGVRVWSGTEGLRAVAAESGAGLVVAATDGMVALDAVLAALSRGIDVALANKELMVAAGELLTAAATQSGARLLPVDSEHSAIWQCLVGESRTDVAALILTASGGPFWKQPADAVRNATVAQTLAHPIWRMGKKNSVDSATMMNKGLEAIEASHFFQQPASKIRILVHPQSRVHGCVVFCDGNVKAQVAFPDMRLPIGYALAYPQRLPREVSADPLMLLGGHPENPLLRYDFERPDETRFPCLALAFGALRAGGTSPATLSAANETAVSAFLQEEIAFGAIADVVERVLASEPALPLSRENVRAADASARRAAARVIAEHAKVSA